MDINRKRPPENERRWKDSGSTLGQDRKVIRELLSPEISNATKQKGFRTGHAKWAAYREFIMASEKTGTTHTEEESRVRRTVRDES